MTSPVAWRWNPYGSNPVSGGPPQAGSPQNTSPYQNTSYPSPTYSPGTIPTTLGAPKASPTGLILIPPDLAAEGRAYIQKYGAPKAGEDVDPRAEVILLSSGVKDLETLVQALATQPLDIAGAKQAVTAADARQTQFFKDVTANLTTKQATQLKPLYDTARTAEGAKKEPAQLEYIKALDGMLTSPQRQTLLTLQRGSENAQLNLQGQLIGQRIRDARAGNGPGPNDPKGTTPEELLSLALADGRALIGQKQQLTVDRKLQDLYGLIMTPENLQKLAPQQQALSDAHQKLQQDPNNADLKSRFKDAQTAFDTAFDGLIDPQDRQAIKGFEAYQRHIQSVAGTLSDEATGERNFYELRTLAAGGGDKQPTPLDLQKFKLAQHQLELIKHNRTLRSLALRSATAPDDEDLTKQLNDGMVTSLRKNSDLTVETRQLNHDVALSKHQQWLQSGNNTTVPFTAAPGDGAPPGLYRTTQEPNGVSPTLQAVNDTKALLDQAKQQQDKLEKELKPEAKKSGWDRALDIAIGVGEVIGGIAVMAFAGWTGIGAVAGGAMIVDGLFRTGHSIADAANGTVTDTPQSRLMQNMGVSRNAANRADMALMLVATVPAGGYGAALTVARSSSMLLKGSGLLGGLVLADGAQAGTRSVVTNQAVAPLSVVQLQNAGLTQTQANYVLALGSFVGVGGLAGAAKVRSPGSVKPEFIKYDPANLPEGAPTTGTGGPIHIADWHTRGAPKELRTQIATEALGPNASPRAVTKLANSMRGDPLVVLRSLSDDGSKPVVGAATVRTNTAGSAGRDAQGNRIQPKSAEIKPILGDGVVKQQTVAAGVDGVKQFTSQRTAFWQTMDPDDASWVPDANLKHQRVRRDAPALLAQLPDEQRPWGTTNAIESGPGSQPLSTQRQLKNLAAIAESDRVNWPTGTRDLLYDVSFDRPLTALGQPWLGKILHPMHKDSYLGQFNLKFNPVNYALSKLRPQPTLQPKVVGAFDAPDGGPVRVATHYPAGTVPDRLLTQLAAAETRANAGFGERTSFNNHPPERIADVAKANLKKLDLVVLTSTDPLTGEVTLVANAAITKNFKGFRGGSTAAFPWLADTHYKPGTTYLGHVFSEQPRGGGQVVLAAEQVAKSNNARHFDFLTQWPGAQKLYHRQGARPAGETAPAGADLPMTVYDARFGTNAAEIILKTDPNELHPSVRQLVDESGGSPQALQAKLQSLSLDDAYAFAAKAPDGALLTRYNIDYSPTASSWRMSAAWRFQDAKYWTQQTFWEPIRQPVLKPLRGAATAGRWTNEHVNPFSLKAFEPGTVRSALRTGGYASTYGIKQSWTTYRGAVVDTALLQAATGNVHIVRNDDRAIAPFNGLPGSESVALYFPWTGTMLSGWYTGPNVRGPAGIDDNGLQPLARASAPLTDPKGPKGAGVLTAARAVASEANLGIRWFGNNNGVSAVTAASLRLAPINVNGRVDVPIQPGGPGGVQAPHSFTWFMPSVSHAFYVGHNGVIVRSLHVTLSGASQTSVFPAAARANSYRSGDHWMLGSKSITTGTGYFFTFNPAYGKPEFKVG